jgi:hypothetical protein
MTLNDIATVPLQLTSVEPSTAGSGVHIQSRGGGHQKLNLSSHVVSGAILSLQNETTGMMSKKTKEECSHIVFQKRGTSVDDTMVGTKAKVHARSLVIPDKSAFALDLNLVPSQRALKSNIVNVRKASSASKAKTNNNNANMYQNSGGTNFTPTMVEKKRSISDVVERISVNLLVSEPGSPAAKAIDITNEFAVVNRRG